MLICQPAVAKFHTLQASHWQRDIAILLAARYAPEHSYKLALLCLCTWTLW